MVYAAENRGILDALPLDPDERTASRRAVNRSGNQMELLSGQLSSEQLRHDDVLVSYLTDCLAILLMAVMVQHQALSH